MKEKKKLKEGRAEREEISVTLNESHLGRETKARLLFFTLRYELLVDTTCISARKNLHEGRGKKRVATVIRRGANRRE